MRIIFVTFFLFVINFCSGNDSITVRYLGIDQGISNNAVTCIFQDDKGFMWFGTYDGLNRYDGYSFRVFRNIIGDSTSVADNHIYKIEGDANHRIWVGTPKGLSVFDPETAKFTLPKYKNVSLGTYVYLVDEIHIIRQQGNSMLVGTQNNGLIIFDKNHLAGKQIQLDIAGNKKITNYSVTCIEYDSLHNITWLFINGVGLCRYESGKERIVLVNANLPQALCVLVRKNATVLIGTDNGLFVFDIKSSKLLPNLFSTRTKVTSVIEDMQHILWIASDGLGLWQMLPDASHPYRFSDYNKQQINSNAIYAIYEDKNDRKWIGTLRGGVNVVETRKSPFTTVSLESLGKDNAANNFILSFCEDKNSNVWIGTDGAGLIYWNRPNNTFTKYLHNNVSGSISSNFITNIRIDFLGDLWVSTWFGGINRFNNSTHTFTHYPCYNPATKQDENNIWVLFEDSRKRLWASATNNGRLYQYDRGADRFVLFDNSILNFQTLAEDKSGNLWGGNYTSLVRIDTITKRHNTYTIGYPVRCIHEDMKNNFWVGTEGGGLLLFDRNKGTYRRMTFKDGLPNNTILRMLEDKEGVLWLSTYNGLCKFNPSLRTFRNFSSSDGLQSNQFSFNAALSLQSGQFLFGGIKGFNIFQPDSVRDDKASPDVFLTGLSINNISIEEDDSYVRDKQDGCIKTVQLPYDKAMLSLEFTALDYTNANKLKYEWYLKGWDKGWTTNSYTRIANYSRLQEGDYSFYVKAMNADGFWGNQTLLLNIKVLPPWYRSWPAYIFYLAIIISAIYMYLWYNKKQERLRYEIKLAHYESEKEKEIAEKRAAFFTHISHEFRTPLTLIINPLKELLTEYSGEAIHKKLQMIQRNAKRLLSLVDQLLLYRKVESIDDQLRVENFCLTKTCNEVFLSFLQHAESNRINICYDKPEEEIWIYGDKEKIEIILFNLISNAIKFTPSGGTVSLKIKEDGQNVQMLVSDNGAGIPGEVGDKLFNLFYQADNVSKTSQKGFGIGLYVSRRLAIAHGGTLFYVSDSIKGTTFTLALMKGKRHFKPENICSQNSVTTTFLHELIEQPEVSNNHFEKTVENKADIIDRIKSGLPKMLVADDSQEMRAYVKEIFKDKFNIYEAEDGASAYKIISSEFPEIVISDVMMNPVSGIELCQMIKNNDLLAHIPVVLLTASSSDEFRLQGIEGGAEDYLTKPFDRDIIVARVRTILNGRSRIQQYFFNTVTNKPLAGIAEADKQFIESCIEIIERHLDNPDFTIPFFCREIGMSHPNLYKKIKSVSGLTINVFIRYLRLRKAAEILIKTNKKTPEVAYITGFNDVKYFREQFFKLFGMKPSEFVQRFRKTSGT